MENSHGNSPVGGSFMLGYGLSQGGGVGEKKASALQPSDEGVPH